MDAVIVVDCNLPDEGGAINVGFEGQLQALISVPQENSAPKSKMSESNYNEVFEAIKTNLVPKTQYEASQREVLFLKDNYRDLMEEWKNMKSKYEEQKLTIEILQAEKESLEAEKKTFEVKVKEVSLKLKEKTYQYESQKNALNTEKISTGSQTIKEEPQEIGVVNVPASCSSSKANSKRTSKRTHSQRFLTKENDSTSEQTSNYAAKRCAVEKSVVKSIESSLDQLKNLQNLQMPHHSADQLFESDYDSEDVIEFEIEEIKDFRALG